MSDLPFSYEPSAMDDSINCARKVDACLGEIEKEIKDVYNLDCPSNFKSKNDMITAINTTNKTVGLMSSSFLPGMLAIRYYCNDMYGIVNNLSEEDKKLIGYDDSFVNRPIAFDQRSGRWRYSLGGGNAMEAAGCGICSTASALATLGFDITPLDCIKYDSNFRNTGHGASTNILSHAARDLGVGYAQGLHTHNQKAVDAILDNGGTFLALGYNGAHYFSILGRDSQTGKYIVGDSWHGKEASGNILEMSYSDMMSGVTSMYAVGNFDVAAVARANGEEKVTGFGPTGAVKPTGSVNRSIDNAIDNFLNPEGASNKNNNKDANKDNDGTKDADKDNGKDPAANPKTPTGTPYSGSPYSGSPYGGVPYSIPTTQPETTKIDIKEEIKPKIEEPKVEEKPIIPEVEPTIEPPSETTNPTSTAQPETSTTQTTNTGTQTTAKEQVTNNYYYGSSGGSSSDDDIIDISDKIDTKSNINPTSTEFNLDDIVETPVIDTQTIELEEPVIEEPIPSIFDDPTLEPELTIEPSADVSIVEEPINPTIVVQKKKNIWPAILAGTAVTGAAVGAKVYMDKQKEKEDEENSDENDSQDYYDSYSADYSGQYPDNY